MKKQHPLNQLKMSFHHLVHKIGVVQDAPRCGLLYGVGVGPGDPELLTLKAVRTISYCDYIAIPSLNKEDCFAYKIAKAGLRDLDHKPCLCLDFPMTKDHKKAHQAHQNNANKVIRLLKMGYHVAFLTIGDPTIYSTYMYLDHLVKAQGFETKIVNGIPSFCASAAALGISLTGKNESLHVIPATYVEEEISYPGTTVYMKSGKKLKDLKKSHSSSSLLYMAENASLDNEKLYYSTEELPDQAGYYSIVIEKN